MNRRKFLKRCGFGVLTGAIIGSSTHLYLNDEKMKRAPKRNGKIIADLHTHPANYKNDQVTLDMLCSPGIVGLSFINHGRKNGILTYENTLKRFLGLVEEIDENKLARVKGTSGYFARTQEITGDAFHILAVGCEGEYLPNYTDARQTVEEIHKKNGVAILDHPYVTPNHGAKVIKYRLLNKEEEKVAKELCEMVDEVEIFNAQNINPTFGIIVPNMKKANERAEVLIKDYGFKGIVASDTHFRLEQAKVCGIYVDEKELSIERLKEDIKTGNFDNSYRRYVSKMSFGLGMFVG
ncbi:hypothetical protein HOA91_01655 [Candidatus Woesearchaeota archaeon]|nr:hypothetical protein [Candidatus Woesearchaeota archaeon]